MIKLSKSVDESLDSEDVVNITNEVAESYGVDEEDVTVEIVYQTTGSLNITINGTTDEDALAEALEEEIASVLGIHESSVEVTVENGTATYVITSATAEDASESIEIMGKSNVSAIIQDSVEDDFSVDIEDVVVEEDITAEIIVTVDTGDASENLDDAALDVTDVLNSYGYVATAESNIFVIEFDMLFEMYSLLLHQQYYQV